MGRKNTILKGRRRRRKQRREHPPVGDNRYWACGRKILYATKDEAEQFAQRVGHTAYKCGYCFGYHTAHIPGSQRLTRRVLAA